MAASNTSFVPSARDLLLVFPRLAQRAGSFVSDYMPEAMENMLNGGSMIASATGDKTVLNSTITNTTAAIAHSTTAGIVDAAFREGGWTQGSPEDSSSILSILVQTVGRLKSFGGIFSYLTSRWALATFTAAIILNRAQFYASSREHVQLRWYVRVAIYIVPILALSLQMEEVLEAMRCQSSPDFSLLRYGDPLKTIVMDFGGEGGFLYWLSSNMLFWKDDARACAARGMSLPALDGETAQLRGSMSLLFGFFLTLCVGQLFETLACALQGRHPMPETGMTIFEHSLAFAECEAMISSALGFGFFGMPSAEKSSSGTGAKTGPLLTRSEILQRLNVPPEVLLVCLISCCSHLSSALLAVSGKRDKVRLINTGIWACCYMSAFIWSFARIFMRPLESVSDLGVLRFPTVCVVGFIPHLIIIVGIIVCSVIYSLALLFTAMSVPAEAGANLTLRQRFNWAYQNLQANVQFSQASAIRVKMCEDFYNALLKVGFNVLTAASEAVYLKEGSKVHVAQMTWVEQQRLDELASGLEKRRAQMVPQELLGDTIASGVGFDDQQNSAISQSPYARERRAKPKTGKTEDGRQNVEIDNGLGVAQRRGRMQLTFDFITGIFWLLVGMWAQMVVNSLQTMGIERRPAWLLKAAGASNVRRKSSTPGLDTSAADNLQFWMVGDDGNLTRANDRNVDVEVEMRRKHQRTGTYSGEETLAENVYSWWRSGGWFGDLDGSGEYEAQSADDDTTSMVSFSSNASASDAWSDAETDSGRRTPTQEDPYPAADGSLDVNLLSRLLNPQTSAEREEARLLSHSLRTDRPMTRSQYRRTTERQRAELLRSALPNSPSEDEERDLEEFILTQRSKGRAKTGSHPGNEAGASWANGAEGMGAGGPQCVVCQTTPRTILVWPCGCLSMCDDCRVGLAARNYTKCICCRTEIAAYSRLYVP